MHQEESDETFEGIRRRAREEKVQWCKLTLRRILLLVVLQCIPCCWLEDLRGVDRRLCYERASARTPLSEPRQGLRDGI